MPEDFDSVLLDSANCPLRSPWFATGSFRPSRFPTQQLFDAFGNSPIGIAICDRRLCFNAINRRLAEINNIPPEAHPGRRVRELVGSLASTIEARLEEVLSSGQPLCNVELIGKLGARPESGHWLENYFPILNESGLVAQVGVFVVSLIGLRPQEEPKLILRSSTAQTGQESTRLERVLRAQYASNGDQRQHQTLTARETDVLRLLALGLSGKEVSSRLAISVKTIETYRARLMLKLHAKSVAHLVHYAIRRQLINLQM
jgi:DNA-binding CsgD family transcriptional regulator